MSGHLADAGHPLVVHTRTRERAAPLLRRGAEWADSPAAVAEASDVVFSIVGYPADVREVMFGAGGVLEAVRPGSVLVDMTTSKPALAAELHEAAAERGAAAVDAPVSGGDVGARNATLSIMVGGDPETFERIRPLLEHLGKTIVYQGRGGSGRHTKMVNQIAICSGMIGVCEALLYGYSGLDLRKVLDSIASGAAGSWSLSNYGRGLRPCRLRTGAAPGQPAAARARTFDVGRGARLLEPLVEVLEAEGPDFVGIRRGSRLAELLVVAKRLSVVVAEVAAVGQVRLVRVLDARLDFTGGPIGIRDVVEGELRHPRGRRGGEDKRRGQHDCDDEQLSHRDTPSAGQRLNVKLREGVLSGFPKRPAPVASCAT